MSVLTFLARWVTGLARWRGWLGLGLLPLTTSSALAVVVFVKQVPSEILGGSRMVRIWVPFGYAVETNRAYPVLYLQDGQNMFSIMGTNAAFGWGSWSLDLTADLLLEQQRMRPVIMVSVDASPARNLEYRGPAHVYTAAELAAQRRPPLAPGDTRAYDAYRRFLIEELKPMVDREYRTLTNAENTGVLGASLGGLVSLAMALERPDIFGRVGCLSGSFQVEQEEFLTRLRQRSELPGGMRVYLDTGQADFTGGDDNRARADAVAVEFRRLGWRDGREFLRFTDFPPMTVGALQRVGLPKSKWEEARRSQHNEFYWRRRAWRALEFLFPPEPPPGSP